MRLLRDGRAQLFWKASIYMSASCCDDKILFSTSSIPPQRCCALDQVQNIGFAWHEEEWQLSLDGPDAIAEKSLFI